MAERIHHLISFEADTSAYEVPEQFTFPFSYTPHPLSLLAAEELQAKIKAANGWGHDYGFEDNTDSKPVGKMFGVLVVEHENKLSYLAAFSGKLADQNLFEEFVPPIYDRLHESSFFGKGEQELTNINKEVDKLEQSEAFLNARAAHKIMQEILHEDLPTMREGLRKSKAARKAKRNALGDDLSEELKQELIDQSIYEQYVYKRIRKRILVDEEASKQSLDLFDSNILKLKEKRKSKSGHLQSLLFQEYDFLNAHGELRNVIDIFTEKEIVPPAGSGDCAAPKLLQYAYQNDLKPIALAEFWWGISPNKAIRKHGEFYPACRSKCEPILGHMLRGLNVEPNPIQNRETDELAIAVLYEDESLAIIAKPAGLLSVPGKDEKDCVQQRMKERFPEATGPLVAHRLDMATSGILLIAKSEAVYRNLQEQFMDRSIKKRYVALLDGELKESEGEINLPLRVDLENRPQQLVCEEHGKPAKTLWKKLEQTHGQTRVHFYPITGRTHQLRVHAAHPQGLNSPIVGDVLYGRAADRLHLHAEWIKFKHPRTGKAFKINCPSPF